MNTTSSVDYVLGRTAEEYERLNRQSNIWEPITKRVLLQAGLQPGMDCLDLGCGTGGVMRLLGEITGQSGSVTGFDTDESIGNLTMEILNKRGNTRYKFLHGNIEEIDSLPGGPYDFVSARLLLIHLNEPGNAIKKMFDTLKPGGILLLQDYDLSTMHLSNPSDEVDVYFRELIIKTFSQLGKDPIIGIRLSHYLRQATGRQADGTDASSLITSAPIIISMLRSVFQSMMPAITKLGYANEKDFDKFNNACDAYLKESKNASGLWPLLGSAWVKK